MQQRKIIIFIIVIFVVSAIYLLAIGSKYQNANFSRGWWSAYFVDLKDNSLDFVIKNNDSGADFHWTVLANNEKLEEGNVNVDMGDQKMIRTDLNNIPPGKVVIEVSTGKDKQDIYKNL